MNSTYFSGNDGISHNFMLFHSHGCICGDFPGSCVLEKIITIPTGFVVTTGNSRYGWYVPWGDGMAAHIHREFVDAYCHDHIPSVGMALREAKIATAPWVTAYGEEGCLRWNIYCLNVLGDGALCPWFEEPFSPNVVFEQGLKVGITSTTVHVSHFETPLDNFCVSLFDGEVLLARGITDENGDAELNFDTPLEVVGEMRLIVTGQSAWPQSFEVTGFNSGEAFVYGDIIALDDDATFGTSRLVSMDIYNKGDVSAFLVEADINTESEYITVIPSNFIIAELAANSTEHSDNGAQIQIANNIPDQTIFTLNLNTYVGDETHTTQKSYLALAPNLQFGEFDIDDSQGDNNGFIDPGERVVMHISGKNIGHAIAPNTYLTATCLEDGIHLEESNIHIGQVGADEDFTADLVISADNDIIGGSIFHLDLAFHYGAYTTDLPHTFSVGTALETFESGDFSFLEWSHDGDLPWVITDEEAHTGTYCARTGAIGDDEVTKLYIFADTYVDGEISFWFKTSTQLRADYLAFFIDGRKQDWWSGENDWTYTSYELTAGSHSFLWLYDKNPRNQSGSDCAWIDDITFPRASIVNDVQEVVTKSNSLYPNPTTGCFTLELEEESNVNIYNVFGQVVMTMSRVSGTQSIDLGNAPKGLYFVQIENENTTEIKKVTIE